MAAPVSHSICSADDLPNSMRNGRFNGKYGQKCERGRTVLREWDKARDRGWGRIGQKLNLSMKEAEGFFF